MLPCEQVILQYSINPQGFCFVLFARRIIYFYINMWSFYFSRYLTREGVKGQFEGEFLNKTQSWRCRVVVRHLPSMCQALGLIPSFKMKAKAKSFHPKQENWKKKQKKMNKIKHIGSNTYICTHAITCVHIFLGAQKCWNGFADRWETIWCQQRLNPLVGEIHLHF